MTGLYFETRQFHPMDTSVDDAMQSIRVAESLEVLRGWIHHERSHMNRVTLIMAISARIRRLEKEVAA